MSEMIFKELADAVGYGAATNIAAEMSELQAYVAGVDALRKAQGRQTLDEEAQEALDDLIERLDAGELDGDPDLVELALLAKEERAEKK
jgi:hypothetical protein